MAGEAVAATGSVVVVNDGAVAMADVVASSAVTAVVVITGAVVVEDGECGVAVAVLAAAAGVAVAPCFFRSSFQHLEQQSPVALLP